jgi:hypothetical protein
MRGLSHRWPEAAAVTAADREGEREGESEGESERGRDSDLNGPLAPRSWPLSQALLGSHPIEGARLWLRKEEGVQRKEERKSSATREREKSRGTQTRSTGAKGVRSISWSACATCRNVQRDRREGRASNASTNRRVRRHGTLPSLPHYYWLSLSLSLSLSRTGALFLTPFPFAAGICARARAPFFTRVRCSRGRRLLTHEKMLRFVAIARKVGQSLEEYLPPAIVRCGNAPMVGPQSATSTRDSETNSPR